MKQPINIFVGTSPNGEDAEAEMVLEYSLRKHTTSPLKITWMRMSRNPSSPFYCGPGGWKTEEWATPFSGFRWAIPEICGFSGKAIYMDIDMINLSDISELYNLHFEESQLAAARKGIRWNYELCVSVLNCEAFKNITPPLKDLMKNKHSHKEMYQKLMQPGRILEISPLWNCLDGEDFTISEIKQLHYTDMSTQPWRPKWYQGELKEHRRKDIHDLWFDVKNEAIEKNWYPNETLEKFGKMSTQQTLRKPLHRIVKSIKQKWQQ